MPATTITVPATPAKLLDIIRGIVAGASKTYPGLTHGNGCQYLRIEPASGGPVHIGDDSTVSATNRGATIDFTTLPAELYERESASGYNNIPLNIWIVAPAAASINVTWQYA